VDNLEAVQPIRRKIDLEAVKERLKRNPRDYALFVLGINSGLRISDLLGLSLGDVIDQEKKRTQIRERIVLREKKTGKSKSFPLNTAARSALRLYVGTLKDLDPERPLFKSRKGTGPISREQAYRILNVAATSCGLSNIGTHTMRKTFGYFAYRSGVDLSFLQKILNHSSQDQTLRYIGILQDDVDDVYRRICL